MNSIKIRRDYQTGRRFLDYALSLGCLCSLVACAGPDLRIKRNAQLFETLPPAEQGLIRKGKIGIGFTADMVRLALGHPDQRWQRTDADGQTEIWSYTSYDAYDGVPLFRGEYHRYNGGFPLYSDHFFHHQARAREYLKVSFKGELVNSIEQDARR